MSKRTASQRGGWVFDGELVNDAVKHGSDGGTDIGRAWSWVVAHNQALCATCGHTRLNHLGFHEPGCSHLGSCSCPAFQLTSERTA